MQRIRSRLRSSASLLAPAGFAPATLNLEFTGLNQTLDSRITFTRASNATLVDSTGRVTYAPNNLVTNSEAFDNASWTKTGATVTANAIVAPNGTTTADKLVEDTSTGAHQVAGGASITGVTYVMSVYAKAAGRTLFEIYGGGFAALGFAARFDLSNGTMSVNTGSRGAIQSVGDGWYRCSIWLTASNTSGYTFVLYNNAGASTYTGDGTSGIYLWGAQLEAVTYQTTPSTYVATIASAYYGPRFDYDPVTLVSKGLLIEEQRTNLLLRSEEFDNASWAKNNGTVSANTIASPDGTTNADAFIENTAASAFHYINQSVTKAASAIQYAASFYVKNKGRQIVVGLQSGGSNGVAGRVDPATGTVSAAAAAFGTGWTAGTLTMTDVGNGWYRVVMTATSDTTTVLQLQMALHNGTTNVYTGDGVSGAYLYGAQIEAGAFATSYIPTVAATVTRSADIATMSGTNFSSWYNQSEGTLVTQSSNFSTASFPVVVAINDGTASNRINHISSTTSANRMSVSTGGVVQAEFTFSNYVTNTIVSEALALKANDFAGTANAATVGTDTSGTMPTVTQMQLGLQTGGLNALNGCIRSISYYRTRLPNSTLQALTS